MNTILGLAALAAVIVWRKRITAGLLIVLYGKAKEVGSLGGISNGFRYGGVYDQEKETLMLWSGNHYDYQPLDLSKFPDLSFKNFPDVEVKRILKMNFLFSNGKFVKKLLGYDEGKNWVWTNKGLVVCEGVQYTLYDPF